MKTLSLLLRTVKELAAGALKETPQQNLQPQTSNLEHVMTHAPKIFTETCKIDFTKTVDEVHNLIRGLSPFPGAFSFLNNKIIHRAYLCILTEK